MVLFSHIHIMDMSGNGQMPNAEIVDKEVIYRSPVYFTPLLSDTELDVEKITQIVKKEYEKAGVHPGDVQTGAVIVTGDTARKSNAERVLSSISHLAGDFVVATAGPEMESILAGKGSGAALYSQKQTESISNVDIGGGTSNIATFYNGSVTDADCLDIGGRLIRFRHGTRVVEYVFSKIRALAEEMGIDVAPGKELQLPQVEQITDKMAAVLLEKYAPESGSELFERLCTRQDAVHRKTKADVFSFSGGVGDLIYMENLPNDFAFDDIGVFLAKAIRRRLTQTGIRLVRPAETIGATVVGASSHSVVISGSTVFVTSEELPIQNIPILKVSNVQAISKEQFSEQIQSSIRWIQGNETDQNVALSVDWGGEMHFGDLSRLAEMILAGTVELLSRQSLLIVLMRANYGKVLGHSLRSRMPKDRKLICLDDVNVENGDYIDIGKPVGAGDALPIVIKTLALAY